MKAIQLGEICHFEKGITGLAKATPGVYPLVTTGSERRTCDTYQFDTKAVCIPLVSSTGHGHASIKNVHYQEGKFALGSILVALTAKDENQLDIQYLHLYLSELKDQILVPLMSGAANVALSVTKIKSIRIPLPNIKRQREIVQKFNVIKYEDQQLKIELTNQLALLKKLRQRVLQDAFKGRLTSDWRADNHDVETAGQLLLRIAAEKRQLTKEKKSNSHKLPPPITNDEQLFELPSGWEWVRFGDIAQHNSGKTLDSGRNTGIHRDYITTSNLYWGYFDLTNVRQMPIEESELEKCTARKGDLLICEGGEAGRAAVWCFENEICFQNHVHRARFFCNINSFYAYYFFENLNATGEINQYRKGMGISNMSGKSLGAIYFPLPPILEQQAIVTKLEKLFAKCDNLETHIINNQTLAEQLMQRVLKEAFNQSGTVISESESKATYA